MAEDRWYGIALPILEYVHDHGGTHVLLRIGDLADALDLDPLEVERELNQLCASGYIAGEVHKMLTGGDPRPWFLERSVLGERGLRVVGAWPGDDPYDALVDLLERRIAATEDPDKKGRLKALKDSVAEVGKATIAGLLVEFAKGNIHF